MPKSIKQRSILDVASDAKRQSLRKSGAKTVKGPGMVEYAKAYWKKKFKKESKPKTKKKPSNTMGVPLTMGGGKGQLRKAVKD